MRHLQDDSVFALGILSDFLSPRGLPAQHRKMLCPAFCLTLCCSRSNGHLFDEELPLAVGIHCHLGSLTFDAHGNLFGTTDAGGVVSDQCTVECGTVFELSPASGGGWTFSSIYAFDFPRGASPVGSLVINASGNLYGATYDGAKEYSYCPAGCGVIFELSPASGGHWIYDHLYVFRGGDGFYPIGQPLVDSSGNIFGITTEGGDGFGNMYELSPAP